MISILQADGVAEEQQLSAMRARAASAFHTGTAAFHW